MPDRWPGGCPMYRQFCQLAFAKRPAEELYNLEKDPDQLSNVADQPDYAEVKTRLAERLMNELEATADPRVLGTGDQFDHYPYRRRAR
jgi:uncharacterized sulfatase